MLGCDTGSQQPPPAAGEQGTVAFVADGDTLRLRDGRRVRLVQIDAPEIGECYHDQASAELERLAPAGTRVTLEADPRLDRVDDYGRLLRYVVVEGENVNVELVRRGAAVPYFFRGERGLHARELLDGVDEARDAHRGLWGACAAARLDPGRGSLTAPA